VNNKDIVVIGTSLGGIEATKVLVAGFPSDIKASFFIVLHIGAAGGSLPKILERVGPLAASNAKDGEPIEVGHIYVAPPDHHLLLEGSGHVRVTRGPKENRTRPAVDPLFRSAAFGFGPRVIGVILTGELDDGTAGLFAIKACGGTAIAQEPEDALAPSMPLSALRHVAVDHCVPLKEIAPLLVKLSRTAVEIKGAKPMPEKIETELKIANEVNAIEAGVMEWGEPSVYTCPECHGVLLQLKEHSNLRFRCHTGHAYSLESLLAEFSERSEENLWNAMRSMEENILLMRCVAAHCSDNGNRARAEALLKKALETQKLCELIRRAAMARKSAPSGPSP